MVDNRPGYNVAIKPPGYTDSVGLMLARDPDTGQARYERWNESLVAQASPTDEFGIESFAPDIQFVINIDDWSNGVGEVVHLADNGRTGRSLGGDTRFRNQLFPGPKPIYLSDIPLIGDDLLNGDFETWGSSTSLTTWAKIDGAETTTRTAGTPQPHGGTYSAKVLSAGAGHGITQDLAHADYQNSVVTFSCWVYVLSSQGTVTLRVKTDLADTDDTSTVTDEWAKLSVTLRITSTITDLQVQLIPASTKYAFFDDAQLTVDALIGPGVEFEEFEAELVHGSDKSIFALNPATGQWVFHDESPERITDLIVQDDGSTTRLFKGQDGGADWEHSVDIATWTPNGLAGTEDEGELFTVAETTLGAMQLWKATQPNILEVKTTPVTSNWATYSVGTKDDNIVELLTIQNKVYIVKETGIHELEITGHPVNLTPDWKRTRHRVQGKGAAEHRNMGFFPSGHNSLWRMDLDNQQMIEMGPSTVAEDFNEYNGRVTKVIGVGRWLYAFLQEPNPAGSPENTHLMVGRQVAVNPEIWAWNHQASINMGLVDAAYVTNLVGNEQRLYFAGRDIDTTGNEATSIRSPGTEANVDGGSQDWAVTGNAGASDDSRTTFVTESTLRDTGFVLPGTVAQSGSAQSTNDWTNLNNIKTDDSSIAQAQVTASDNSAFPKLLTMSNFGFSIPTDAVIVGVELRADIGNNTGGGVGNQIGGKQSGAWRLHIGGSGEGDRKVKSTFWPTSLTQMLLPTSGANSDLWGISEVTPAEANASNFGIEFQGGVWGVANSTDSWDIDHVAIKIYYTRNYEFKDVSVTLVGGAGASDNKADTLTEWGDEDEIITYGGRTDTWGTSFSVDQSNAITLGVRLDIIGENSAADVGSDPIDFTNFLFTLPTGATVNGVEVTLERSKVGERTAGVDHVTIKLYYSPGSSGSDADNNVGYIAIGKTVNPRRDKENYQFVSGATVETGWIQRLEGWTHALHEIELVTSDEADEQLGSGGRSVKFEYDIDDGNGWVELGGSGNGTFSTSPRQKIYFKTASISADVTCNRFKLRATLNLTSVRTCPVIEEIIIRGVVRPPALIWHGMTVLAADDQDTEDGHGTELAANIKAAIEAMFAPGPSTAFYDRDGDEHFVYMKTHQGFRETEVLVSSVVADGDPEMVRAYEMLMYEIPGSENWT